MFFTVVNTRYYAVNQMTDLLLETSIEQLVKQSERAFPNTTKRQHATDTTAVVSIEMIPQKDKLLIKGQVRGSQNKIYDVIVQFQQIKYNPPGDQDKVSFVANEQTYTIAPIAIQQNNCKVRCTCLDFRFRFAVHNFSDNSLYGAKPAAYHAKSRSNRGPANPTHTPGVCKHIMTFVDELHDANLFV